MTINISLARTPAHDAAAEAVRSLIRPIMGDQWSRFLPDTMLRAVIQVLHAANSQNTAYCAEYIDACWAQDIFPVLLDADTFDAVAAHIAGNPTLARIWALSRTQPIAITFAAHHEDASYYCVRVNEDTTHEINLANGNFCALMDGLGLPHSNEAFTGGTYTIPQLQSAINAYYAANHYNPSVEVYLVRIERLMAQAINQNIQTLEAA